MSQQSSSVDFTSKVTSMEVRPGAAGSLIMVANVEGSSEAFGPFIGTLCITPAGYPTGTWDYHAYALPTSGAVVTGSAHGRFESIGTNRWKVVGAGSIVVNGVPQRMRLESEADLASRGWNGKLIPMD